MGLLLAGRDKKVLSRCSCLGLPVADAAARKRHEQMKAQRLIKAESAPRVIVFASAFLYTIVCCASAFLARARKVLRKERDSYNHVCGGRGGGAMSNDRGPPDVPNTVVDAERASETF